NPFVEKLLLEATLELVAVDAIEAVQDLGAAGLTCASSEVAAKSGVGMRIDVGRVPRRARGMTALEVMLSESQERMLVVARPGREADVERVFERWELQGTRIGEVTSDERLEIRDGDTTLALLPPRALADDAPEYDVTQWASSEPATGPTLPRIGGLSLGGSSDDMAQGDQALRETARPSTSGASPLQKIGLELLELLASTAVASRRTLYRSFDSMVGTDTVLGPGADAAVLRIKGRPDGIAVAIDAQPRVAAIDPFAGAALAVAEATRNLVCVGATPLAITDCLNLGNPERPRGAYDLEQTVDGIRAVRAAHDRSDGGLGVALAELAIRDGVGMKVTLPAVRGLDKRVTLFGEGPSGVVLVVDPAREAELRTLAEREQVAVWTLGTIGGDLLEVAPVLGMPVASLVRAHGGGLAAALGRAD